MMSFRMLKIMSILLPVLIIGGFEYIRHDFLLHRLSMETGNLYITIITLILSYLFATWMFGMIQKTNRRLAEEQSRRAVFEERERLARELHDNIAQVLFFLNVKLKQGQIDDAKSAIREMDNTLRQAIFNLRSNPDDGVAFSTRLVKWLEDWMTITGIDVEMEIEVQDQAFSMNEEVLLFGIIQEAFTNIRKHSQATEASIRFAVIDNEWQLHITDNGNGMDDTEGSITQMKYGLSMLRRRAEELGAELHIDHAEHGGMELHLAKGRRG